MQDWQERIDVSIGTLSPAANEEEYRLHCAALEWSLADPIVIESLDDVQSKVDWKEGFSPFHHQVRNLITFCRCLPVTLLADDVGLGKTISAALILCELMKRRRVTRALVVCPSILRHQWVEELEAKVGIYGRTATGQQLGRELNSSIPVVVTTYESLRSRIEDITPGSFDLIILDEAHKLRNLHGTQNPPLIATQIRSALERRLFKYVLMLTATPIQNRLWDLYSLIDCLTAAKGHQNPLGTPKEFAAEYISDGQRANRRRPGTQEKFRRELRKYVVRTRREDARLSFPERSVNMFRVEATSAEQRLQQILAGRIGRLSALAQTSLAVALMSSPQAFLAQVENMASRDNSWNSDLPEIRQIAQGPHTFSKEQGLLGLVQELKDKRPSDWRMVVFTTRKETQRRIGALLDRQRVSYGYIAGGQSEQNARTVKAFMADPPELSVIVSTDAGAEGVNLQKCNVLVNYDLPWNPMVVEQRIGRIQRLASQHRFVTIFNLCIANSSEERVVGRLMSKLQTISETVGDIEAILESTSGGDGDMEESFASQIRELVVKSMLGQDVEEIAKKAENSIDAAKRLMKEQADQIDQHLGRLDELHDTGPEAPKLSRTQPGVGYKDFVFRAIAVDKGEIEEEQGGVYRVSYPNRLTERFTFDESAWRAQTQAGVFMGVAPKLFLPGKPAFERLVQHWVDRVGHHLQDDVHEILTSAQSLGGEWISQFPDVVIKEITFTPDRTAVEGSALIRAAAINTVDSYEKLVAVPTQNQYESGNGSLNSTTSYSTIPVEPRELIPNLGAQVETSTVRDSDISKFCEFYSKRLQDELAKAGTLRDGGKKLQDDFSPNVHSSLVGFEGRLKRAGKARLNFAIDDTEYSTELEMCPSESEIFDAPLSATCEETNRVVPDCCLEYCDVTQRRVLAHLLAKSDETGRRGLSRLLIRCEQTQRQAFPDETARCEVSGKEVVRSLLAPSAVSGRLALPSSQVACEFTNSLQFPDEVKVSEISGKVYRADQCVSSAVSNLSGHSSEFLRCALTNQALLPDEAGSSEVSGRCTSLDKIVKSERPPHRKGLADELVKCEITGSQILIDEAEKCTVTDQLVDKHLLIRSAVSGNYLLPAAAVSCAVTGDQIAPRESGKSNFSGKAVRNDLLSKSELSGRVGLDDEFGICEFTNSRILLDELQVSSCSGKRYRIDQQAISETSQKKGHRSEFTKCSYSGRLALIDEMAPSAISSRLAIRQLLTASEKSGRLGVQEAGEVKVCEVTGRRLLSDEVAASVVSGKIVDVDLLEQSAVSGKRALREELLNCESSGIRLLPDEVERCEVSGKRVDRRLLGKSELSGRLALKSHLERCSVTQKLAMPDELGTCEETGKRAVHEKLGKCSVTSKNVIGSLLASSDVSGRRLLSRIGIVTQPDGRFCAPDEIAVCQWSRQNVAKDELVQCRWSGINTHKQYRGVSGALVVLKGCCRILTLGRVDLILQLGWSLKRAEHLKAWNP